MPILGLYADVRTSVAVMARSLRAIERRGQFLVFSVSKHLRNCMGRTLIAVRFSTNQTMESQSKFAGPQGINFKKWRKLMPNEQNKKGGQGSSQGGQQGGQKFPGRQGQGQQTGGREGGSQGREGGMGQKTGGRQQSDKDQQRGD